MDVETGLYYCNARYYDPEIYQWIQPAAVSSLDSLGITGLELYNYENNNSREVIYNNSELENFLCRRNFMNTVHRKNLAEVAATGCKNLSSSIINNYYTFPKINSVAMTHYTISLIENEMIGSLFANISYTVTTQLNDSQLLYSYNNVGNDGYSTGFGINLGNWYGFSTYVSSNYGIGISKQLTPWITYGTEISLKNGVSFSLGIITGNTTQEITANVGVCTITMAYVACAGIASLPMPGARALAGVTACIILLIDIFN